MSIIAASWAAVRPGPMSDLGGGLNRSTQHFILERKDGVYGYGSKISSRFHGGRENGVMGPLAAWRVFEGDWASVWSAIIVYSFPGGPVRGHASCATASVEAGIDARRARGDFQRHYSASIGTIDGQVAGPFTVDGEPRNQPDWRL